MLRNLFANPRIRFLLLTGTSLTDSKDALIAFFERGVDVNWQIVGNGGQIDRAFPIDELNKLRESVRIVDAYDGDLGARIPMVQLGEYAEPKLFPHAETTPDVYPSEHSGLIVRGWLGPLLLPAEGVRARWHAATPGGLGRAVSEISFFNDAKAGVVNAARAQCS
jgi:hypothetical protein